MGRKRRKLVGSCWKEGTTSRYTDACNAQLQDEPKLCSGNRAGLEGRRYSRLGEHGAI